MISSPGRTLVVAAHPDDEVLGCGGTIARWAREGGEVYVAILGEGITSRYETRDEADPKLVEQLSETSRRANDRLGVSEVFTFDLPDNRFDTVPLLDVVKIVESLVGDLEPEVVLTQHGGDLNVDHSVVHRATLIATRPTEGHPVRTVCAYEVPSSTDWAFQQFEPRFTPNLFVDIEETIEDKIAAMEAYESEARDFPHPRSPEALRATARRWGSFVGLAAAEAFQVLRHIVAGSPEGTG